MGHAVKRKRVTRLMGLMAPGAFYPRPKLGRVASAHERYPYLLGDLAVYRPNQAWATDIG